MAEPTYCKNGHLRTEENTAFHLNGAGTRRDRRCLDCRNKVSPQIAPKVTWTERIEDIEDLIRFGSSFSEIMERGSFNTWNNMRNALRIKGRHDLIEILKRKQAA